MGTRVPQHICDKMKTEKMQTKFRPREMAYDYYETNQIGYGNGYVVNINHPDVLPIFHAYNDFIKETGKALSDSDRAVFELDIVENVSPDEFLMTDYSRQDIERIRGTIKDMTKYDEWVARRRELFGGD